MEFAVFIVSGLLAILSVIGKKNDKKNPVFIFCVFWATIVFFASFYWLGYNKVSNDTWKIILIGICSYAVGAFLMCWKNLKKPRKEEHFRINRANIIGTIGVLYTTFKLSRALPYLLKTMSFAALRKEYWIIGGSITVGTLDYIFDNFFISAIALAITVIAFTELFGGKRRNYILFCSIYLNLASVLCSGGRLILLNLVISAVGGFWISGKGSFVVLYKNLPLRTQRFLKRILIVGIAVIMGLTIARQGSTYSFFEALYSYFTLELSLMDYVIKLLDAAGDVTYGFITTMGITQPFAMLLQLMGCIPYPEVYNTLAKYTSPYFDIGGVGKYNAFVTQFFYFYLDGRIWGVIIADVIIGALYMYFYQKVKHNYGHKYIAIYLIIIINILQSGFIFSFSYPYNVIAVMLVYFIYGNTKIKLRR